jgi:hypothetical protein
MQVIDILKIIGFIVIYILLIFSITASSYHILSTGTTQQIFNDNTVSQFDNLKIIGNLIVNDNVTIENTLTTNNVDGSLIDVNLLKTQFFKLSTTSLTNSTILFMKSKIQFMKLQLNTSISKNFDFTVSTPVYNVVFPFGLLLNLSNFFATGTSLDHFVLESEAAPNFNGAFAKFIQNEIWLMSCIISIQWGSNSGLFVTPASASIYAVAVDESINCTGSRSISMLSFQNADLTRTAYCLNNMIFETPMLNSSGMSANFFGLGIPISYNPTTAKGRIGKVTITSLDVTFRRLL